MDLFVTLCLQGVTSRVATRRPQTAIPHPANKKLEQMDVGIVRDFKAALVKIANEHPALHLSRLLQFLILTFPFTHKYRSLHLSRLKIHLLMHFLCMQVFAWPYNWYGGGAATTRDEEVAAEAGENDGMDGASAWPSWS